MRKILIFSLLILLSPVANAAPSGGGGGGSYAPAPTPTPTPSPATSSPTPMATPVPIVVKSVQSELEKVNLLLGKNDFSAAFSALKLADAEYANNADVNNLLGFSARKLKQYKSAATYYTKALKINPNHLGALEYQGELFVQTKKMAAAKKNLAKLKKICGTNCGEYLDLKKAIGK